jgi:hypothetical protein
VFSVIAMPGMRLEGDKCQGAAEKRFAARCCSLILPTCIMNEAYDLAMDCRPVQIQLHVESSVVGHRDDRFGH